MPSDAEEPIRTAIKGALVEAGDGKAAGDSKLTYGAVIVADTFEVTLPETLAAGADKTNTCTVTFTLQIGEETSGVETEATVVLTLGGAAGING